MRFILYEAHLGINYSGYPVDQINEEEIQQALIEHDALRLKKNVAYKVVLTIEEDLQE